eukprot:TRINITY_DN3113_c0_g1_i1.p1 TRINITY_DN3113_c0_g1~~TRINITY_DN3113_c0_g1_i1.p1  ORF type:complete len:426 (+),score=96.33 TRINITY_DN3113_c0_g1_i1:941-2218(+)
MFIGSPSRKGRLCPPAGGAVMPAQKRKATAPAGSAAKRPSRDLARLALATENGGSKSKTEWRVDRAQCWRELDADDPDDADLVVEAEDSPLGDSVMMSDALYVGWGAAAVVGDCIRTALFDLWYFTQEHTCPGSAARMQREVEQVMEKDTCTAKSHGEMVKIHTKVISTARSAETATRQRLRGLGVTSRDVSFDLLPGQHKQVVCPVKTGDLFFCTFYSQESQMNVTATLVERDVTTATALSEHLVLDWTVFDPSRVEMNPPGFTSTSHTSGDIVISFNLPEAAQPCMLSVFVMKIPERSVRLPKPPGAAPAKKSKWVCAACGFARAPPTRPVGGSVVKPLKCLLCDCVEATVRGCGVPPSFDPPGVKPPGPFSMAYRVKDTTGVLFSVNPLQLGTFNRTLNTRDGVIAADLYDRPLPPLPPEPD